MPPHLTATPTANTDALVSASRRAFMPFRFLDLPRELRDMVYAYAFPSLRIQNPRPPGSIDLPPLMFTSKQVYSESRKYLCRSVTVSLWSHLGVKYEHPCDGFLPRTPIMEAQTIRIRIVFNLRIRENSIPVSEHIGYPWHWEHMVACLPAEVVALTALLRQRKSLPNITVHFKFLHVEDPTNPININKPRVAHMVLSLIKEFLQPLRQLAGVPGGGMDVTISKPLKLDNTIQDRLYQLANQVRKETSRDGAHHPVLVEEACLLFAHYQYLQAKTVYDAHQPWDNFEPLPPIHDYDSDDDLDPGYIQKATMAQISEDVVIYFRTRREDHAYRAYNRWGRS